MNSACYVVDYTPATIIIAAAVCLVAIGGLVLKYLDGDFSKRRRHSKKG